MIMVVDVTRVNTDNGECHRRYGSDCEFSYGGSGCWRCVGLRRGRGKKRMSGRR
jgi:hypothetical protein